METLYTLLNSGFKITSYIILTFIYFTLIYLLAGQIRKYVTKNYRTFLTLTSVRFSSLSYCNVVLYVGSLLSLAIITEMFYTAKISLLLAFLNIPLLAMMLVCFEIKYPRKLKTIRIIR